MAKNILIIGNGGREHALAWKVRQDGHKAILKTGTPISYNKSTLSSSKGVEKNNIP